MRREHGNSKAARLVRPRVNSISAALWPLGVHRYVATNWLAQMRRAFMLKELAWLPIQRRIIHCLHVLRPLFLLALLCGIIFLIISLLQYWLLLLALAAIWSILVILATRVLIDNLYSIIISIMHEKYYYQRNTTRFLAKSPQFPETPMPATPLIRVLETIDLSTMDIEHFISDVPQTETTLQTPLSQDEKDTHENVSLS